MSQYIEKAEKLTLPVLPLHDAVAFPSLPIDFETDDPTALAAVEAAGSAGMNVFLVCIKEASEDAPKPDQLYSVGTVARIRQSVRTGDSVRLICECRTRASVSEYYRSGKLITASVLSKDISLPDKGGIRGEAYVRELRDALDRMLRFLPNVTAAMRIAARTIDDPAFL